MLVMVANQDKEGPCIALRKVNWKHKTCNSKNPHSLECGESATRAIATDSECDDSRMRALPVVTVFTFG